MTLLRTLLRVQFIILLCSPQLAGQAQSDSTSPVTTDLSGRWRLSSPRREGLLYATLRQTGTDLEAEIAQHIRCAGRDVKLHIILRGFVQGHAVSLQSTTVELEGDFGDPCVEDIVFIGQAEFQGQVSSNGKKITGPYDHSGLPDHTWTFSR